MMDVLDLSLPPRMTNHAGAPRRVGVEIEFASLSAETGAHVIQEQFGGDVEREDVHRFHVRDTSLGDFTCELDMQFAHRDDDEEIDTQEQDEAPFDSFLHRFREAIREFYGDLGSLVVPYEIVCPPVPFRDLPKLESILEALQKAGAADTRASPFYGFGAHLNPEIAKGDMGWVVSMLKSYLLLSDWLRAVMRIDLTRRLIAFANPFPRAYITRVVDPEYWPDQDRLIDDYLRDNPTRNRELDMLPLFAWLDRTRVFEALSDPRISPRPTFHYRLPDANFGQPNWRLLLEWNRWCVVERLAERRDLLDRMGAAYLVNEAQILSKDWALQASEWVMES